MTFMGIACLALSCKKSNSTGPQDNTTNTTTTTTTTTSFFAKGADVSWLTQMEAANYKFYNSSGVQEDCMQILKEKGMNTIRLRAWVNPADGWCNTNDVIAKAVRAKTLGMKIMIDFHYSDSWADPGKQPKPAVWANLSFTDLVTTMHDYTVSVLNALIAKGVTPDWVQVGNEVSDGMLWEDGRASTHMANFAALIKSGYDAVKSVDNNIKVIVHLNNGYDNSMYRWLFDGLKANNAKWDIIGMSLYPSAADWQTKDAQCLSNMNDMVSRYGTPVMIVEVGMDVTQASACKSFLTDLIAKVKSVNNQQGLGVLYWEPESYNWQNYGLGAFDSTGKPTIALDAFVN